jgi:hypothetical protein
LSKARSESPLRRKKRSLRSNGSDVATVRTRHGAFPLRRRRFLTPEGESVYLLPDVTSGLLRARCVDWATRFPFSETARLLAECCGVALFSEDGIWRLVHREASRRDEEQEGRLRDVESQSEEALPPPRFRAVTDIHEGQAAEFLAWTDAICVASQKPTRQKVGQEREGKDAKRHDTDVFVLPREDGSEQFFCEGVSEKWSCVAAVSAFLRAEWSGACLSVVAITDGATKIRCDLSALFGEGVRVILDWYHLAKRVTQTLSMAAHPMREREEWEKPILSFLWSGEVGKAVEFLSGIRARREKAKTDLLGYLQKHAGEIIDYGRRQKAGKPIGSGRIEKAVDQVIGLRQKNRGMAWTKAGSRALALLTVARLNARPPAQA